MSSINFKDILTKFKGVTDIHSEKEKLQELHKQFKELSLQIFNEGYFCINGCRRIYPTVIEFYYHEEGKYGLKDPIMYHRNQNTEKPVSYFILGSFNFHVSGLDITFENEEQAFRASFLIREYDVYSIKEGIWIKDKSENRSTYIYEDMLMGFSIIDGLSICWISEKSNDEYTIKTTERKNVASYHTEENKFVKDEISNDEYKNLSELEKALYFSYSGKKYKKCIRQWSFHRTKL